MSETPVTTLAELLDLYVARKLMDGSPETIRQYNNALDHLTAFIGRMPVLDDLAAPVIEGCMRAMKATGSAPRTCNKLRACFNALGRFAAMRRLVHEFPDYQRMKEPVRAPAAWSIEQLQQLWDAYAHGTGEIGFVPAPLFWRSLHSILWDSAERIEAVKSLPWECVDLKLGYATFRAETRKGGRADAVHKLHPQTVELLDQMRRLQRKASPAPALVLPWTLGKGTIYYHFGKIVAAAGLPTGRDCMFHRIRKSAATHFEALGGDATALLSHADARTTKRHYIDTRLLGRKSASDVLQRPDQPRIVVTVAAADPCDGFGGVS